MNIYVAYTGSRWSEVIGLPPECVHADQVAIDWKLYELNGRFYRGRPRTDQYGPPTCRRSWLSFSPTTWLTRAA